MSLDPLLAELRLLDGRRRYYPPGQHPATARLREHLRLLQHHREALVRALAEETERAYVVIDEALPVALGASDLLKQRRMVEDADEAIEYVKAQLALFEEGESICKLYDLKRLERRER